MIYRQIHVRIWKGAWFLGLDPGPKLLFIYLFSNELASIAGIYELPLAVAAFETGISQHAVTAYLADFQQAGRVDYDPDHHLVWVRNLRRYNASKSPKVQTRIQTDLARLPDCPVKARYTAFHYPTDTVSLPYPPGTPEHDNEKEKDNEQERESAVINSFLHTLGLPDYTPGPTAALQRLIADHGQALVQEVADWCARKAIPPADAIQALTTALQTWKPSAKAHRRADAEDPRRYTNGQYSDFIQT